MVQPALCRLGLIQGLSVLLFGKLSGYYTNRNSAAGESLSILVLELKLSGGYLQQSCYGQQKAPKQCDWRRNSIKKEHFCSPRWNVMTMKHPEPSHICWSETTFTVFYVTMFSFFSFVCLFTETLFML